MVTPRFYCAGEIKTDTPFLLPKNVAHHATRTLRLRAGDEIVLFNGQGGEYHGLLHYEQGEAQAIELVFYPIERENLRPIILLQALPSGDKMEWIIEKAVELGASGIIPIKAERSILQLEGKRLEKRLERWHSITISASEQCGRNRLLQLHEPITVKQWCHQAQKNPKPIFLAHPTATLSLHKAIQQYSPETTIYLSIGPEGGWAPTEIALFTSIGANMVSLGPRVLRTETAGLAMLATLQIS